jgi:glutaminyl-tRNA synthetase
MAPAPLSPELEALCAFFKSCGLSAVRSEETVRGKIAAAAKALFSVNQLDTKNLSDKQGLFALQVAKDGGKLSEESRNYAIEAIVDGRLKTPDQVTGESTQVRRR